MNTASYKSWHKANMSDKAKFHQGYFRPVNQAKCLSRTNIYRSSWELKFMEWADRNPAIQRWASEPVSVKYLNPVVNMEYCRRRNLDPKDKRNWKLSNYWTDFWIEVRDRNTGKTKKIFIEIKPYKQTQKPYPVNESAPLKAIKRYNLETSTYLINISKWSAAKKYFNERGCDFMVVTEHTLEKLGLL